MDQFALLQMMGGGFGSGLDIPALLAFIAFAIVYLIIPALGYTSERPGGFAAALYLLIGYGGLSLIQVLLQWFYVASQMGPGARGGDPYIHLLFPISALKILLFLIAMSAFAGGLRSLRLRRPQTQAPQGSDDELQQLRDEIGRLRQRLDQGGGRGAEGIHGGRA